jgi:hypothetical protein
MRYCEQVVDSTTYHMCFITQDEYEDTVNQEIIKSYRKQYKPNFAVFISGNQPLEETITKMLYSNIN